VHLQPGGAVAPIPTLILHGKADEDVPVEQAFAFHRLLRDCEVPVELALYAGENHGIKKRGNLLDMSERVLRWLRVYVIA
jgi:dipeptidyl aminopeptidase/acylaminoacyl peptidase